MFMNNNYEENPCCRDMNGYEMNPITECPQEQCCHRYINHRVPHIVPINTRVINHHIMNHEYIPYYTCCEEDVVTNVYGNRCDK